MATLILIVSAVLILSFVFKYLLTDESRDSVEVKRKGVNDGCC